MTIPSANTTEQLDLLKEESRLGPGNGSRGQDGSSTDKVGADSDSVAHNEHLGLQAEAETQRLRIAKIKQPDLILFGGHAGQRGGTKRCA
jgi:hypothetical protein